MMDRAPSLREIRAAGHANVAILPTAAPRQVRQHRNTTTRRAACDLRRAHTDRFAYAHPHERAADEAARALNSIERSPAYDVLDALMRLAAKPFQAAVISYLELKHLDHPDDLQAAQAYWFVQRYQMTNYEIAQMRRAFERLRGAGE